MKEVGVNVGDTIDVEAIAERDMSIAELHNQILNGGVITMSWGFNSAREIVDNKVYNFKVQGHHHNGYVYIALGWDDTFKIYYTDLNHVITEMSFGIYTDVLIEVLDRAIEKIDDYVR